MIYSSRNVLMGCTVHDVEGRAKVKHVIALDTDSGEVTLGSNPFRVDANGHLATEVIRFRSIYPICVGNEPPLAFHCYGRGEQPFPAPLIPLS